MHTAFNCVLMVLGALLHIPVLGWTTIAQTAFGGQFAEMAASVRSAYVNNSVLDLPPHRSLSRIWHTPADVHDTYGLGGGIAFAWDPQLCEQILPLFREDIFFAELVSCGDIQQSMSRAMNAWSQNHRLINFLDVTGDCERNYGGASPACPLVELWITHVSTGDALSALGKASGDVTEDGTPVALATSSARYVNHRPQCRSNDKDCMQFRMTNGQLLPGRDANFGGTQTFIETYAATVSFGVSDGTCWYLDSAFCSTFHQMKKWSTPSNVLMATRLLCFFIFASAALSLLFRCRVFGALHRRAKRKKKVGRIPSRPTESPPGHRCGISGSHLDASWVPVQIRSLKADRNFP